MSFHLPCRLGLLPLVFFALIQTGCRDRLDLVLTESGKASAHADFVMEVLMNDITDQTIEGKTDAKGKASIFIDDWDDAFAFWFSVKQPGASPLEVSSGAFKNGKVLFQSDRPPYSLTLKP
jgi:hypothetical protein